MKISVIIPCYNVADYVAECLDSAFAQTHPDLEVIAVDNGSSDGTLSVLRNYQEKQPELTVLEERRRGAPAARNTGLRRATGEYVQFLDADDLLLPEKISHQTQILSGIAEQVAFVAAPSLKRRLDGTETAMPLADLPPLIALFLGSGKLGNTVANLWRHPALLAINGWNEDLRSNQETDLMFRLLRRGGQVLRDTESLCVIRERSAGRISDQSFASRKRFWELRQAMLTYLQNEQADLYKAYYHQLYSKLFDVCRLLARQNAEAAAVLYRTLPQDFRPLSLAKRFYKKLIDVMGFARTERWRQRILGK